MKPKSKVNKTNIFFDDDLTNVNLFKYLETEKSHLSQGKL